MSKENDKIIHQNTEFNDHFYTDPNNSYLSNAVPFQPMPLQNHYFPPQQMNFSYGMSYSNPHTSIQSLQVPGHYNNYSNSSCYEEIPNHQSIRYSIPSMQNLPSDISRRINNPNNHYSSVNSGNNTNISLHNGNPKDSRIENSVLQASAQTFVPRGSEFSTTESIAAISAEQSQNSLTNKTEMRDGANYEDSKSFIGNGDSTRPKDSLRKRRPPNKKYEYSYRKSNWRNKENKGVGNYNSKASNNDDNFFRSENQSSGNNYNNKNWRNYSESHENGYVNSVQEGRSEPYNSYGENIRSKQNYQNRFQKGEYNKPNFYYENHNGIRKNETYQRNQSQNFNGKRNEWRRSNDQSQNNYYNQVDGSKAFNFNKSGYYNKKGPKNNYSYQNFQNVSIDDNKPKHIRQKNGEYHQYKQYKENQAQGNKTFPVTNSLNEIQRDEKTYPENTNSDEVNINDSENGEMQEKNKEKKPFSQWNGGGNFNEKLQRENLVDNLTKGTYECMVCCDRIKPQHAIWSCEKCFNCFHLGCIKKWAGTSQGEPGWRCPACQNQNVKTPNGYFCFCKKQREPEWNRREIPHSCGEVCGKKRANEWCTHKCVLLCHPGPCPDCTAFIKKFCQCGKNSTEMRCSQTDAYVCAETCNRLLECGVHTCSKLCHPDTCGECSVMIEKVCFCGKEKKTEACTSLTVGSLSFSCNAVCQKSLSCGHHTCDQICHEGSCQPCSRAVDTVTTCPCGKMDLKGYFEKSKTSKREKCVDPIPLCNNICEKVLKCGTPGNYHKCMVKCHEGQCPPCKDYTEVKCRCGSMDKKIPCSELFSKADEVLCEKQCKKLRQCGRHKCGMKCCIDIDHVCSRICGRTLKCKLHKCQQPCHRGNCPSCWETSFEELTCHCGSSILYPPVPCGTEPPSCDLPCTRQQSCSHVVSHTCHSDPVCPPCTTLVPKPCFGNHTIMKSTPCYVNAMSCGEQCAKKLACGVHLCQKVCHDGPCIQGTFCGQKCQEIRSSCDHPCNNLCHSGPCPNNSCKEMVTVSCRCGHRKVEMVCSENEREYKNMATSKLASELHSLNSGGSVNISHIYSKYNKSEKLRRLDCNDECALIERNRQLALSLQISNPEAREALSENGMNLYSDSLKEEAKKDISFAQMVHSAINELVMKAKQSKQKSRSHSFAPMNRDKRKFIHEYAKYFGCQSQSYDEEPKKNVVVTAVRNMCRLPPMSVVAVIQKEQNQRKVPGPVFNRKSQANEESGSQMRRLEKNGSFDKKETPTKDQVVIDYFDFS